jgi:tRNA pseudouridine38-40 synthase
MHNIKLTLAYDGTEFHGWQIQPGQPTIQGALTDVLRKITQENIQIHAAGRTDVGVHARGQVAHFKTGSELTAAEFQRAFNALLPPEIRVVAVEEVGPDFHARWNALSKTYEYRIFRGGVCRPSSGASCCIIRFRSTNKR